MHLDMDFNHFASAVAKVSIRKLPLQAFLRQLLAHYVLKKSWMTFSVSTK
jgi:hypothetical protein